jgi:hypothetical protein
MKRGKYISELSVLTIAIRFHFLGQYEGDYAILGDFRCDDDSGNATYC